MNPIHMPCCPSRGAGTLPAAVASPPAAGSTYPNEYVIPDACADVTAWRSMAAQWLYVKPLVYEALGVRYGLYPELPETYPVIVKPAINLHGLGWGARLAHTADDIANAPGCLWMPVAEGDHLSVDVTTRGTDVSVRQVVRGVRGSHVGVFRHWERIEADPFLEPRIWEIARLLGIGMQCAVPKWNIEFIGTTLIEIHLRGSDEFAPLDAFRYCRPIISDRCIRLSRDQLAGIVGDLPWASCLEPDGCPERVGERWYRYAVVYGDDLDALYAAGGAL